MKETKLPYERMIWVCTNSREDGRQSCANPGCPGKEIAAELKAGVKARGLKHKIRVAKTGCQDLCGQGPIVTVWPEGVFHKQVSLDDIPSLIEKWVAPLEND